MKKIEVIILEADPDYLDKIDYFYMEVPEDRFQAIAKAIEAVENRGYNVLPNNQGGNNEYIRVDCDEEYIAVTVRSAEGEG